MNAGRLHLPSDRRLVVAALAVVISWAGEGGGRATEPAVPEADRHRAIEIVITPGKEPSPPRSLSVFTGSVADIRWIVREAGKAPFRLTVDVFQVLTSTLAPVETGVELGTGLSTEPSRPVEVEKSMTIPSSERPARFLLKLWLERDDRREALSIVIVDGTPPNVLDPVRGKTIRVAGFDSRPSWMGILEGAGAIIETVSLPSAKWTGAWSGPLIANWPDDADPASVVKLAADQQLIAVVPAGVSGGHPILTLRPAGNGLALTFPSSSMQDFAVDPEAQKWLVHGLTTCPETFPVR